MEEPSKAGSTHVPSETKAKGGEKNDPNMNKSSSKLPYLQRLKQEKIDKEFAKFIK